MLSEEKKNVKQEKAAATKQARKSSVPVQVAYIGPPIRGVVQGNVVFNNGLPEGLKSKVDKHPVLGSLIVPVSELGASRKALKDRSSALYACYEKALQIFK